MGEHHTHLGCNWACCEVQIVCLVKHRVTSKNKIELTQLRLAINSRGVVKSFPEIFVTRFKIVLEHEFHEVKEAS